MDQKIETEFNGGPATASDGELTAELYGETGQIDLTAWSAVIASDDWPMSPAVIAVQERSLAGQARIWCLAIKDRTGHCQACAALALFRTDIVQASPKLFQSAVSTLRRFSPKVLRMGILFCGLPIPDGGSHLRIAQNADRSAVLKCLDQTMQELARRHRARFIVVKEFETAEMRALSGFNHLGYITGDIPPMHRLTRSFDSFDAYRDALRSSYRRQVDASLAKFAAAGLTVRHHRGSEDIARHFTDDFHQLYLNVLYRNDARLEEFPASFFRDLPRVLPDHFMLTVIEDHGRPLAFAFGLDTDGCYSNLYVGVDYSENERADLYFNAFYHPMRAAFARGVKEIKFGATSSAFKSRLGANASPTQFFARTVSPMLQPLFGAASGVLFPAVQPVMPRSVFKQE